MNIRDYNGNFGVPGRTGSPSRTRTGQRGTHPGTALGARTVPVRSGTVGREGFGISCVPLPARPLRAGTARAPGAPGCARQRAFTMVEIAIALGVIAFALVAIIGVLPVGLKVQRDNRADTIINQDGTYWMEAIRDGAQGVDELVYYVDSITNRNAPAPLPFLPSPPNPLNPGATFSTGREVIGLLSTPTPDGFNPNVAYVRALSGSAAEKTLDPNNAALRDFAFSYRLRVSVTPQVTFQPDGQPTTLVMAPVPFEVATTNQIELNPPPLPPDAVSNYVGVSVFTGLNPTGIVAGVAGGQTVVGSADPFSLYLVRLEFAWPVLPGNQVGKSRQVFQTLVTRSLVEETNRPYPIYLFSR